MPETAALACDAAVQHRLLYIAIAGLVLSLFLIADGIRSSREYGPENAGFLLSYLTAFWMNHWFSLWIFLLPWYCPDKVSVVSLGAEQSLIGLAGLVVGSLITRRLLNVRSLLVPATTSVPPVLRNALLGYGLLFYLIVNSGARLSGLQAVLGTGQSMIVASIVLAIWQASRQRDRRRMLQWCVAACAFPLVSILISGFLGFGVVSLIPVIIFTVTCWGRVRWSKLLAISALGGYIAISFFVTYLRDRAEIRRSVWGNDPVGERLDVIGSMLRNFEWFSIYNTRHLDAIDARLDQNYLVGAAVVHIGSTKEWAEGKTLVQAALAFIPRALWPEKPEGGSGSLVSEYTGLQFAYGTSVGIGQVMEFYVNFGSPMVFIGFCLFGVILKWLDTSAINALRLGNFPHFITLFLLGISIQQIGGSLVELVGTAAASMLLAYFFQLILANRWRTAIQQYPIRA